MLPSFTGTAHQGTQVVEQISIQQSKDSLQECSCLITRIPLELRYLIYDTLMSSRHTIKIAPNSKRRGVLRDLAKVNKQIRKEIRIWISKKSSFIRSPIFGILNPVMTKFKIAWADHCLWEGRNDEKCMYGCHEERSWEGVQGRYGHFVVGQHYRRLYRHVNGPYTSRVMNRHLGTLCDRLEWWQWAMDLSGSIDSDILNKAIEHAEEAKKRFGAVKAGVPLGPSSMLRDSKRDRIVPTNRLRENAEVYLEATRWLDWMQGRT